MKALVCGGSGFVGSHVADALSTVGYEVTVFDRRPSRYLRSGQRMTVGDMLDRQAVIAAAGGQQVVFNFAGLADIGEAMAKPIETAQLNILGCAHALEAARLGGATRFVQASTIYVSSAAGGFYRASKQACELWVEEYQRQFGLDYTILRYGTLYGGRTDARNSVHRYLREALTSRRITVQGTGDEIREYIHVRDAAESSVAVLSDEFRNESVVLTGHQPMRFRDLLHMIREIVGPDVVIDLEPTGPGAEPSDGHYRFTPYSFRPKIGRKLIARSYIDLGQGLMECLEEIHEAERDPTSSTWP